MSELDKNVIDFEILGHKVRYRASEGDNNVSAKDIVDHLKTEALKLKENFVQLNNGKLAVLLALQMAEEKLILQKEYKDNIGKLHLEAKEAIDGLDNLSL